MREFRKDDSVIWNDRVEKIELVCNDGTVIFYGFNTAINPEEISGWDFGSGDHVLWDCSIFTFHAFAPDLKGWAIVHTPKGGPKLVATSTLTPYREPKPVDFDGLKALVLNFFDLYDEDDYNWSDLQHRQYNLAVETLRKAVES